MKTENILYLIGAVLLILGALMRITHFSNYAWFFIAGSAIPLFVGIYTSRKKKDVE